MMYTVSQFILALPSKVAKGTFDGQIALYKVNEQKIIILATEKFEHVAPFTYCNLIGAPRSWQKDPKRYRQALRLHVYPERHTKEGVVLLVRSANKALFGL